MSDFFEPGKTYLHHGEDGHQSDEGLFRVEFVGRAPEPFESYDETIGVAFGWRQGIDANGDWTGLGSYVTPDFAGWQEVRPALDAETPDGCRWCGIPRPHGRQYLPGVGQHGWQPPTDRQRLERMQARRAGYPRSEEACTHMHVCVECGTDLTPELDDEGEINDETVQ